MGKRRKFVWAHLTLRTEREEEREANLSILHFSLYSLLVFIHSSLLAHECWHIYSHAHLTHINKRFVAVFKCSIPLPQQQGCGLRERFGLEHPPGSLFAFALLPFLMVRGKVSESLNACCLVSEINFSSVGE